MRNGKIIVVDDNEVVLKTLRMILSREFGCIAGIPNPALLPALLRGGDVDVVLLDMNFGTGKHSGNEGLFWLDRIREIENPPAVVLITAYADIDLAVACLKKGAADFIVKPWDNEKLIATVAAAREKRQQQAAAPGTTDKEQISTLLLNYFLKKQAAAYGKPFPRLDTGARQKLHHILWLGNIRQVEQSIESALLLARTETLTAADFPAADLTEAPATPLTLEEMEKQFIEEVLREKNGNLTLCAQQLDISRQTLYNKMKKYNL